MRSFATGVEDGGEDMVWVIMTVKMLVRESPPPASSACSPAFAAAVPVPCQCHAVPPISCGPAVQWAVHVSTNDECTGYIYMYRIGQ